MHRRRAATVERALTWISASVAMQVALTDLAGTGQRRHAAFLQETRAFQLSLREFMYPRVVQAATGPATRCEGCRARMAFTEFDAIPAFAPQEPAIADRLASPLKTTLWLLILAGAGLASSLRRAGRWVALTSV